jgi:hypothetical protein
LLLAVKRRDERLRLMPYLLWIAVLDMYPLMLMWLGLRIYQPAGWLVKPELPKLSVFNW